MASGNTVGENGYLVRSVRTLFAVDADEMKSSLPEQ
jgi:hypothetical protein